MKPTNIPEKEFLTPEGYRLHRAEMMAAEAKRREFWQRVENIAVELGSWLLVGGVVWFIVWVCKQL